MFNFFRNDSKVINVNDIDDLIGKINLIDIREIYEFKGGSIKGAKNIPMNTLLKDPSKYLNKEKTYYILCQSGARSGLATRTLAKQGFDVINVSGGLGSYVGTNKSRHSA